MAHSHQIQQQTSAFKIGVALNTAFIVLEAGYGFASGSLALVADAGHNLSDVLGLLISWLAIWLGQKSANDKYTYGYKSSSILAALFNAVFLLVAIGAISVEAIQRLSNPGPVAEWDVIIVAAVGVVINGFTALLFMKGQKHDLNIKGAFLHMAADAGVSIGVVIAGFIILKTGWFWLDPVVSLLIAVVILIGTWGLLRDAMNYSLEAVPNNVDRQAIADYLTSQPTVNQIHDLHIWGMSTTETAMTVHLCRSTLADNNAFLEQLNKDLSAQFPLTHITIQIELGKVNYETTDSSI
ncbi:cation diffusion facilitator family transporter [Lactiplantibacillus plantarum]|jgi:cobalt-zinc-cadmium efflux system protein|uniref:cation diffusion facilitator family transporter n=1 Tax=Lactiplantibacillus plantarum TaxID=1590 RepID=UPI0006AD645F|nr:cation diffusion facilitator family transporter [Lactiplantibacillus plantarum]MCM8649343.1 cation diffusion facilitator family transporter [Lactiplantibacillus sp. E932]ALC10029.1 cation efflux protein [Lactiplantibacillus plantarum]ARO01772.1 cation transporter [Lactiplantibacillus plantarum]ARO04679.1 cation transporter [Lactiplantibacillus plantarum]ARO07672.1 cation transporter [Lactiplantibacillus plantarum]